LDFRLVKNFPEAFPLSLQIKNLAGSCRVIECAERKGTFGNLQPKCGPFGAEIAVPPGKLGIPRKFHLPTSVRAASGADFTNPVYGIENTIVKVSTDLGVCLKGNPISASLIFSAKRGNPRPAWHHECYEFREKPKYLE
jgi:hypothetical protein